MKILSSIWKKILWTLYEMWAAHFVKYGEVESIETDVTRVSTSYAGRGRWTYKIPIVGVRIDRQYDEPGIEFSAWESIRVSDRVRVSFRRCKGSEEIGPSWVTHWQPKGTDRWIRCS